MTVYRIERSKRGTAAEAFSGLGGQMAAGRWHRKGQLAVYCGGSLAVAVLEKLVHCPKPRSLRAHVWFRADIPDDLIETPTNLPDGWDAFPYVAAATYGARWIDERRSVGLKVPSVIVPEPNLVINPTHPDFALKWVEGPFPLNWDERLA